MLALPVLFFCFLCIGCTLAGNFGVISSNPIRLSLLRSKRNGNLTTLTSDPRTQIGFFRDALGLQPGQPFEVDINKWDSLTSSGLFANLTAVSEVVEDGVCLNITGIEIESRVIAPEISAAVDANPQPSGGIVFRDPNFRGMGESLELIAATKPSIADNALSSQPSFNFRWIDRMVGRMSKLSVTAFHQNSLEHWLNLLQDWKGVVLKDLKRICTQISGLSVCFERFFQSPAVEGISIPAARGTIGVKPYLTVMEPLGPLVNDNSTIPEVVDKVLIGVKTFADVQFQRGLSLGVWHDGGHTRSQSGTRDQPSSEYHQIGFHSRSPTFHYPHRLILTRQVKVTVDNVTESHRESKVLVDGAIGAQMKLSGMRSWGPGAVPLFHQESLDSSGYDKVRGFPFSKDTVTNGVDSFCLLQTDVFYDTKTMYGKVGVFADNALYSRAGSDEDKQRPRGISTMGLSWRVGGFKFAVGNPLDGKCAPRLHFGLE